MRQLDRLVLRLPVRSHVCRSRNLHGRSSRLALRRKSHLALRPANGGLPGARLSIPSAVVAGEQAALTFPQIAGWQLPVAFPREQAAENLFHEIRRAPNSVATWIPFAVSDLPSVIEVEPNDTIETATTALKVPASFHGVLGKPRDVDSFAFELAKDQKLNIQALSRTIGSAADLELVMFDADGREVPH